MDRPPGRRDIETAAEASRGELIDELARHAAAGNNVAAGDLAWAVLRYRLAQGAIRQYLISDADVDAAEQATLVAVAFRIQSWRGDSRFTTWLYQVAKNEARQLIRSEKRHSDRAAPGEPIEHAEQFIARVSSMIADAAMVRRAIEELGDDHRRALLLREEQGLTYDEIADQLQVPLSTAKTWVRRARAELAVLLTAALTIG